MKAQSSPVTGNRRDCRCPVSWHAGTINLVLPKGGEMLRFPADKTTTDIEPVGTILVPPKK